MEKEDRAEGEEREGGREGTPECQPSREVYMATGGWRATSARIEVVAWPRAIASSALPPRMVVMRIGDASIIAWLAETEEACDMDMMSRTTP